LPIDLKEMPTSKVQGSGFRVRGSEVRGFLPSHLLLFLPSYLVTVHGLQLPVSG